MPVRGVVIASPHGVEVPHVALLAVLEHDADATHVYGAAVELRGGVGAGGFIGAPYRLDITKWVKPGANTLEAKPFRLKYPKIVVAE